jgi:hypothetical protein
MPIRLATVALFVASAAIALTAPAPVDLPAVALGQTTVYRLEILLALVYGGLLLLTPLFQGAIHGHLPIELSHRGARWPEQPEKALELAEEKVARLEAERDKLLQSKHSRTKEPR